MGATEIERVRMSPRDRRLLRQLARESHKSKSDVLREGLRLVARVRARKRNVHILLRAANLKGDPSTKARLGR